MWRNKFNGFLGIWIIALAFLAFSVSLQRFLMVLTGSVITITAFWGNKIIKPTEDVVKRSKELEKELEKEIENGSAEEI
ncbi:MAG: hypothetical protein ABII97_00835 [Patescibacteria group bacterium]